MKKFITAIILLSGLTANASLKLSATANMYDKAEHTRPAVGLAFYQPLFKKVAFNAWAGGGVEPFEQKDDVTWTAVKSQLDFTIKDLTVSPGIMFKDVTGEENSRDFMYVKVEYKLF